VPVEQVALTPAAAGLRQNAQGNEDVVVLALVAGSMHCATVAGVQVHRHTTENRFRQDGVGHVLRSS
jgi:hypothetical protein